MPISSIMSRGETTMVSDLDLVNPTVIRPKQSSMSSVGIRQHKSGIKKSCAGLSNHGYCLLPSQR